MIKNEFATYKLNRDVLEALTKLKYLTPTEVQRKAIPPALDNKNIVVKSKTGSGKTAAFAIPIVENVVWEENAPQALVLEPTRELAYQVKDEVFNIGRMKRIKVPVVFGGAPFDKQALSLKQKSHVVVGTPGRVLDHLQKGTLDISQVKYFIIDEADLMLDMGFLADVKEIMSYLPEKHTTMLFSATLPDEVDNLANEYMSDPVKIMIEDETVTQDTITQLGYEVENEEKFDLLLDVLYEQSPEYCMIFCSTREMVNVLFRQLKKARIRCGMLHGMVDQMERLTTIDDFRQGKFTILIATDVAARGIDFDTITHVINYDMPNAKETYVHRIGRTGRNGKTGTAITFINDREKRLQGLIEEYTNAKITMCVPKSREELQEKKQAFLQKQKIRQPLKAKKGAVFNKDIMKLSIGGGRKSKMRAVDIVGTICSINDVAAEDIGIIDVRDSLTYVEILNGKGKIVLDALQNKPIKAKIRKVRMTR
ncbi:MAG: DEAD/DEAH box helicase [bacterium]|nr:DEAD/DEAH box helicase [bacterium]